jgi:uncharacterized SAM-binding protein YcdF (DUF218 family)
MDAWTRNFEPGSFPACQARTLAAASLRQPRRWRDLRVVAAASVVTASLLGAGFLVFLNAIDRTERAPAARADGIVVLTGGAQRISDAIDLLAQGYGSRLLITGVNEKTSRGEIAKLNPGQRRLFDCCVDLDYRARNTIGNAIEARRWTEGNGFRSLIVVTSNYHMPRTLLELGNTLPETRKVAYPVVAAGSDLGDWWTRPQTVRLLVAEYLKTVVSYVRTRLEADPEHAATAKLASRGQAPIKLVAEPLPHRAP